MAWLRTSSTYIRRLKHSVITKTDSLRVVSPTAIEPQQPKSTCAASPAAKTGSWYGRGALGRTLRTYSRITV